MCQELQKMQNDLRTYASAQITEADILLGSTMMVGQGWVCALDDNTMALTQTEERIQLAIVRSDRCGLLHMDHESAKALAERWNANRPMHDYIRVEAKHYRDLLKAHRANMNSMRGSLALMGIRAEAA